MQKNYLIAAFEKTAAERFPEQAPELLASMHRRIEALREDNAGASREKWAHLESQIMPGIAIYESLQTVVSKEEAIQIIHSYVNAHARKYHTLFRRLLKLPGLYHTMPGIFAKGVEEKFGPAAGFQYIIHEATKDVIRFDMVRCPYHDACAQYDCPELCRCFCDSDDITYDGLHPKLLWHRTKTLGRGDDCCDFGLRITKLGDTHEI